MYPHPSSRTVLVVDDDDGIREALRGLLEDEGFVVHGAENGAEAIALLQTIPPPSLILLDLMMPVLDGRGVLQALRADPRLARIPVAVISAARDIEGLGDVPLLKKPIDVASLMSMLHVAALGAASAVDAAPRRSASPPRSRVSSRPSRGTPRA